MHNIMIIYKRARSQPCDCVTVHARRLTVYESRSLPAGTCHLCTLEGAARLRFRAASAIWVRPPYCHLGQDDQQCEAQGSLRIRVKLKTRRLAGHAGCCRCSPYGHVDAKKKPRNCTCPRTRGGIDDDRTTKCTQTETSCAAVRL